MNGDDEKMIIKSFNIEVALWDAAKKEARRNQQSLSAILRRLLRMWLAGEIDTRLDEDE